jgi:hypothetical protein
MFGCQKGKYEIGKKKRKILSFLARIATCLPLDICDGLFLEIIDNSKKKFVLGNVHRPSNNSSKMLNSFHDEFSAVLEKFTIGRELVLAGNFNIGLLKIKANGQLL